ncbi:unnamed protein product [Rhizoctonia solani]|uniref:Uncharacterized protein n=1 Tax=Rhizoctonia solani TaxID=456999 RepID=A0A8H3DMJ5_9AGAM|nr:unnamed protein product [Rhizoctonia solani]
MPAVDDATERQIQEDIRLLKNLRSRGLLPLITAEDRPDLPRLSDVQGDSVERFLFFRIVNPELFKAGLRNPDFKPTSSQDVKANLLKIAKARDDAKLAGGRSHEFRSFNTKSRSQGRAWTIEFSWEIKGSGIICLISQTITSRTAGDTDEDCTAVTEHLKRIFELSIEIPEQGVVDGQARPGKHRHDEHFGYKDGISQPAIRGLGVPLPGQILVDPGVIIAGFKGDPALSKRPEWAKNGAMMVFRKLEQSVVEWDKYMLENGQNYQNVPGGKAGVNPPLSREDGAQLLGARLIGRWKSGAPIALKETSLKDDPDLGGNPKKNNNFDYSVHDVPSVSAEMPSDYYCPFTAHSRKVAPRNLDPYVARQYLESGSIIRAGIAYGPEVSSAERDAGKDSEKEDMKRGLLFNCYASHLNSGFVRQATGYGSNDFFPITGLTPNNHGQDPIIGGPPPKGSSEEERGASLDDPTSSFTDGRQVDLKLRVPNDTFNTYRVSGHVEVRPVTQAKVNFPFFVTSRGGEYFFVPSIPTLKSWGNSQ